MGDIFKNLGDYGLQPWMIFVIVLVLGLSTIFHKTLAEWGKKLINKKKKKYGWGDFNKHTLFSEVDSLVSTTYYEFETDGELDRNKTYIFNEFVKDKLLQTKQTMLDILELDHKVDELTLKNTMDNAFIACNNTLAENFKLKMVDKGIPVEDVQFIMSTFLEIRRGVNEQYMEQIEDCFANPLIEDNETRVLILLSTVRFELKNIIRHSKRTFDGMNGRFKNLDLNI